MRSQALRQEPPELPDTTPMEGDGWSRASYRAAVLLGLWLACAPWLLAYRSRPMQIVDGMIGLAVAILGVLALRGRVWATWAIGILGTLLLMTPLVLWSPDAVAYFNDTAVGALLVAAALLVPGAPGFGISAYLASFQLGYLRSVWDPFFGDGTRRVLESVVSRAWPVSDAGLGAVSSILQPVAVGAWCRNLACSAAVGIWLMAAPAVLGTDGTAASSDHITGALVVTVSVFAMGEVARTARWANWILGAWLVAATWFLPGSTSAAAWSDALAGATVIVLSFRRGRIVGSVSLLTRTRGAG